MRRIVAVDIGGTNLRIGLVNESLVVEVFERVSSHFLQKEGSFRHLGGLIQTFLTKCRCPEIEGISIGVPSMVDKSRKRVYRAPNLEGLTEIHLADLLEEQLGYPVQVDRDVNFLLLYDIYRLRLDPDRNKTILGFYVGTGLGNPIYIEGRIFRGKNGVAGELAHTPVYQFNDLCPCGNHGCVELLASGKALERLRERLFPETPMERLFIDHKDHPEIHRFVELLSYPIATEITILDPDYVIFSSGVLAMPGFPRDQLREAVLRRTKHPHPAEGLEVLFPNSSHEDGLLGGAIAWFD